MPDQKMRRVLILLLTIALVAPTGCSSRTKQPDESRGARLTNLPFVYRMTVQQGNIVTQEMVDRLQPGMTRSQVRYLLGTPLLTDMFHQDRWDYTYTIRRGHQPMQMHRLTLLFQGDALVRIDGNLKPTPGADPLAPNEREILVEVPDWQDRRGLLGRALGTVGVPTKD